MVPGMVGGEEQSDQPTRIAAGSGNEVSYGGRGGRGRIGGVRGVEDDAAGLVGGKEDGIGFGGVGREAGGRRGEGGGDGEGEDEENREE